ncbi:MAG: hypothetical protein FWC55_01380 [Firmicutes bacterium]|nr:hypothetical protein [Bacillota bacterium]
MDFAKRKRAWYDLYAGKRDYTVWVNYNGEKGDRPLPYPENGEKRFEWALNAYRKDMEALSWLNDDKIPPLRPYTGTEIFAAAFGCKVHYPGDNMPFALPLIRDVSEFRALKTPRIEDSRLLSEVVETADRLRAAEPGAIFQLPDIQSPFDIAALIWEKTDFFSAMYEEPGAVKELTAMTEALLAEFLDMWFGRFGTEFVAHYPDYYMPRGITLSEDEAGSISPGMFREFCLPGLNRLSERYGAIGVHCCADSEHQWENFRSIKNLTVLNLVRPDDTLEKAYRFFRDACVQTHNAGYISVYYTPLVPGTRRIFAADVSTKEEAEAALRAKGY